MEDKKQNSTGAEQPKEEMEQYDPWDIILFGRPRKPEVQPEQKEQPKATRKKK
ncbi:hypothetical protein [Alkalihalobacillus sp. BA299]|uniref:hypothetical protein n=1 Tax=Alkalihalobacillus sp. BA299 TaxID=2815938 RepID=UPI001ADD3CA8|nr:hypothetical protein [Alkalihalobacillus sp. BA299]